MTEALLLCTVIHVLGVSATVCTRRLWTCEQSRGDDSSTGGVGTLEAGQKPASTFMTPFKLLCQLAPQLGGQAVCVLK